MALKLEDGTGGDTLLLLQPLKDYCAAKGYDISDFDDAELEQGLRRGSNWISTSGFSFNGWKVGGREQIQCFPRNGCFDSDGLSVSAATIPREVQSATAEATFYELNNPNGLNPDVVLADRAKSERVGPIEVEYAGMTNVDSAKPVLTIVDDLLRPLISTGTSSYSPVTARADRG